MENLFKNLVQSPKNDEEKSALNKPRNSLPPINPRKNLQHNSPMPSNQLSSMMDFTENDDKSSKMKRSVLAHSNRDKASLAGKPNAKLHAKLSETKDKKVQNERIPAWDPPEENAKDRQNQFEINKFVEEFKQRMLDIKSRLEKEEKNYLSKEYSRRLSADMYSLIIDFNFNLRGKRPLDEQLIIESIRNKFKPFFEFKGFLLPLISSSKLTNGFDETEEFDWTKRVYFLHKIQIMQTEQIDPIHRILTREHNKRIFYKEVQDEESRSHLIGRLIRANSPKLSLIAMQYGLLTVEDSIECLKQMQNKLNSLLMYTKGFKRYTRQGGAGVPEFKQGQNNVAYIEEEEGDKIMTELNNFLNSNKRRDVERAVDIIKFIMHCIVLVNDTEIERLVLQDSSQEEPDSKTESKFAFDFQPLFKEIKSTLFTSLVSDNFESLIGLKDEKIVGMINQVIDSLLGDCNDMYGKSLKMFLSQPAVNKQPGMGLADALETDEEEKIAKTVEKLQTLILEIVEGRRDKEKYSESKELKVHVEEILLTIKRYVDAPPLPGYTNDILAARQLTISNIIHLLLNLATMFTVSEKKEKENSCQNIRTSLEIIQAIFKKYPPAKCLLLGGKEWFFFKRLYQFYPCECIKLLFDAIQDNQPLVLNSNSKATNLLDFLLTQLTNELPKYLETSNRMNNQHHMGTTLMVNIGKSKLTETDQAGLSIILINKCLSELFVESTDRLVNRCYSSIVQRKMLQFLADYVWPLIEDPSINSQVSSIEYFKVFLRSNQEIDFLVADLQNLLSKDFGSKAMLFEIAYSILFTLNQTCLYSKVFCLQDLDTSVERLSGQNSQLALKDFIHLASFKMGLPMLAEISKLLSHVMVMEYGLVKQDYAKNDVFKDFGNIKDDLARFKTDLECLLGGIENYFRDKEARREDLVLNIFIVRGILEPMYKLTCGVTKLSAFFESDSRTEERLNSLTEITSLFDLDNTSETNTYQMFRQYFIIDDLHKTMVSVKGLLPSVSQTSLKATGSAKVRRSDGQRKRTLLVEKPLQERERKAKTVFEKMLDIRDSFLFALENISIDPIKKEFKYYQFDLPETLQEEPTTKLVTLPEDGCLNMIQLREKIAKCLNLSQNVGRALLNKEDDRADLQAIIKHHAFKTMGGISLGQHGEIKQSWTGRLVKACLQYLNLKRKKASSEKESGFKNIDEGIDERPDAFYLMLLYLIAQELARTKDHYYFQMKLENAKNRRFWFNPLDVLLASKPSLIQLLKIFDNLLMIQGGKIRRLFCDTFFEMASEDSRIENDENEIRPLNDLSISPFKMLKQMGLKSVEILFHSVISLQRKITRSVFENDYVADCQLYFLLCFNIKGLAEENFLEMKQLFQKLKIDVDNKHRKNKPQADDEGSKIRSRNRVSAFSLILKGVVIPKTESREVSVRKVKHSDRSELVWYNTVTLMLLSELAFGIEAPIEDISTSRMNSLLLLFNNVNIDVFSPRFDMLEEGARLMSYLLEGSQTFVDNLLNLKRPDKINPDQMYLQIVTMIKLLIITFIMLEDNPKQKVKTEAFFDSIKLSLEPDIEKTISNTEVLVDYYKKYQKFANHPIVKISRLLNKIMNTLALSNSNRRFASYMEQLRAESELVEEESYTKTQKLVTMAATSIIRGFKKSKKTKESRKSERGKFQGIVLYNFLHKISATVEIAIQEKKSMTLEFAIIPEAYFISDISKDDFINSVAIGDHNAKLVNMMDAVEAFSKEGTRNYRLSQKWPVLYVLARSESFQLMTQVIWLIAAAMNAIALVKMDFRSELDLSQWHWLTLYIGNFTIVGLSFLTCLLFILTRSDRERSMKFLRQKLSQIKQERFFNKTIASGKLVVNAFEKYVLNQHIIFSCLLYILFSSLSLAGYWYFMPFQLLLFAQVSQTASNIIQSIRLHTDQLIRTFFILLLLIYTYSLIVGLYFRDDFQASDTVTMCETVWSCFIYCTDLGLRAGGGIGDLMTLASYKEANFFPKFAMIMTHFSFINTISLNIFAGIIIDTFSELRKRLEARSKIIVKQRLRWKENVSSAAWIARISKRKIRAFCTTTQSNILYGIMSTS